LVPDRRLPKPQRPKLRPKTPNEFRAHSGTFLKQQKKGMMKAKALVSPLGSDPTFTNLVDVAAGALTATLAAKLLGRPRPAKRRRARQPVRAKRGQRTALGKGGGRNG
jgi:hypothetical protein